MQLMNNQICSLNGNVVTDCATQRTRSLNNVANVWLYVRSMQHELRTKTKLKALYVFIHIQLFSSVLVLSEEASRWFDRYCIKYFRLLLIFKLFILFPNTSSTIPKYYFNKSISLKLPFYKLFDPIYILIV